MSYRVAFWSGLATLLLLICWLCTAGMSLLFAAFILIAFVGIVMLVLTRCVSEVGLLMLQPVFRPMDLWAVVFPKALIGQQNLTIGAFLNGAIFRDPRNIMPAIMDAGKASDITKVKKSTLLTYILISVFVGVLAAAAIQLYIIYNTGGVRLNSWFFMNNPKLYFDEASNIIKGNIPFDYRSPVWFSIGSLFTLFLYSMRAKLWWWPFHPLGYAMGCAWPAVVYASSFFVGWLIKSIILRYGGAKIFRTLRPFFLGLILGEFAMGILWSILSGLFGLASPAIPIS